MRVTERTTLDFKKEFYERSDAGVREFLADASSFANTQGGDLVYGVEEDDEGTAIAIPGVEILNRDAFEREWDERLRAGVSPRLPGAQWGFVLITAPATYVVILRVSQSTAAPHRIVFKNYGHFYARAPKLKYQMDVSQLRDAFLQSDLVTQRIRAFVAARVGRIASGNAPTPLARLSAIVLHLIPLTAFTSTDRLDFSNPALEQVRPPLHHGSIDWRRNLDGRVTYSGESAYTQVFESGAFEGAFSYEKERGYFTEFDEHIVAAAEIYVQLCKKLDIGPPVCVMLSVTDARGLQLAVPSYKVAPMSGIQDHIATLPEIYVESWPESVPDMMRPLIEGLWHGLGIESSPNYPKGVWTPPYR